MVVNRTIVERLHECDFSPRRPHPTFACMIRASLLAVLSAFAAAPLAAQGLPDDLVRAELLPGWRTPDGTRMTALRLRLAPGWKTYWRAPGEAGIPPSFDWRGSRNVGSVSFHWPEPQVFDLNGYRTLAYGEELVLPIEVTPKDPGAPVSVAAKVALGVCEDVCVPVSLSIEAELPDIADADPVIEAALASQPQSARAAGLAAARCEIEPIRDGLRLTARLSLPARGGEEFAVVELGDGRVWVSEAETSREGGELVTVADLVPPDGKPFALDRRDVRITVFGDRGAVDVQGCTG
jgi:DsbC/DsbD-like thiol-disulfide interchange protein